MFCAECGTQNPDTNQFCKNCGKPLRKPQQVPAPQPAAVPAPPVTAQPPVQPVYYPPQPAGVQPPSAGAGVLAAPVKPRLNKGMLVLSIVGIIIGIGSWVRYPYILGILAIVFGGIAIAKPESRKGVILVLAVLAVLIGLASIVFDMFYLTIMPPVPPVL
jgi:hypothetical protein